MADIRFIRKIRGLYSFHSLVSVPDGSDEGAVLGLRARDPEPEGGAQAQPLAVYADLAAALLSAILPGNLIGLCMMDTMRCRSVMRPAVIVFSLLMIAAAIFDLFVQRGKK